MAKADSDPVATRMRRFGIEGIISPLRLGANSISAKIKEASAQRTLSEGTLTEGTLTEGTLTEGTAEEEATLDQSNAMRVELEAFRANAQNATEPASATSPESVKGT